MHSLTIFQVHIRNEWSVSVVLQVRHDYTLPHPNMINIVINESCQHSLLVVPETLAQCGRPGVCICQHIDIHVMQAPVSRHAQMLTKHSQIPYLLHTWRPIMLNLTGISPPPLHKHILLLDTMASLDSMSPPPLHNVHHVHVGYMSRPNKILAEFPLTIQTLCETCCLRNIVLAKNKTCPAVEMPPPPQL